MKFEVPSSPDRRMLHGVENAVDGMAEMFGLLVDFQRSVDEMVHEPTPLHHQFTHRRYPVRISRETRIGPLLIVFVMIGRKLIVVMTRGID